MAESALLAKRAYHDGRDRKTLETDSAVRCRYYLLHGVQPDGDRADDDSDQNDDLP